MAKKRSKKAASARKRRKRRTEEEMIADLEAELERVRARQRAKRLQSSPAHKGAMAVIKAIDRALDLAAEESQTLLRHTLADARRALGAYLQEKGVELPKANIPKGPRPKELEQLKAGKKPGAGKPESEKPGEARNGKDETEE